MRPVCPHSCSPHAFPFFCPVWSHLKPACLLVYFSCLIVLPSVGISPLRTHTSYNMVGWLNLQAGCAWLKRGIQLRGLRQDDRSGSVPVPNSDAILFHLHSVCVVSALLSPFYAIPLRFTCLYQILLRSTLWISTSLHSPSSLEDILTPQFANINSLKEVETWYAQILN